MTKSKFTKTQIVGILCEGEAGLTAVEVCRKHGISLLNYSLWKNNYFGVSVSEFKLIKNLAAEKSLFKSMFALLALKNIDIKDLLI